jgi:hypothetical protein
MKKVSNRSWYDKSYILLKFLQQYDLELALQYILPGGSFYIPKKFRHILKYDNWHILLKHESRLAGNWWLNDRI